MGTFAIKADRFVLPGATMQGGYLTIEDGVFGMWSAGEPDCEIRDLTGCIVGPGLVDTHIHGFYNHATTDRSAEGINASSVELARRGTTCWLPTTFTESVEQVADSCAAIAEADEGRDDSFVGARIGGIYLEGPFFTEAHVGAQNPVYLIDPSVETFDMWQEKAGGRIVKSALAAEKDGACAYCAALDERDVVTSTAPPRPGRRGRGHDHQRHLRGDHLRRPPRRPRRHQGARGRQGLGPHGPHHRLPGLRWHA